MSLPCPTNHQPQPDSPSDIVLTGPRTQGLSALHQVPLATLWESQQTTVRQFTFPVPQAPWKHSPPSQKKLPVPSFAHTIWNLFEAPEGRVQATALLHRNWAPSLLTLSSWGCLFDRGRGCLWKRARSKQRKPCQGKPQSTCVQLCHWLGHTTEPCALCQDGCLGGEDPRAYKGVGTVCNEL